MDPGTPQIFVDDASPEISFNGPQWSVDTQNSNNTFGLTQHVYTTDDSEFPGNLSISYVGELTWFLSPPLDVSYVRPMFAGKGLQIYGTYDPSFKKTTRLDSSIYTSLDNTAGVTPGTVRRDRKGYWRELDGLPPCSAESR